MSETAMALELPADLKAGSAGLQVAALNAIATLVDDQVGASELGSTAVGPEVFARLVRHLRAWSVATAVPTPTSRAELAAERLAGRVRARASRTPPSARTTRGSSKDIQE